MTDNKIGIDLDAIGVQPSPVRSAPSQKSPAPVKAGKYTFYKIHSVPSAEGSVKITKFDSDLEVISSYFMNWMPSRNGGYYDCQCPASRFDCRHKPILQTFQQHKEIDGDRFFCFETRTFKKVEDIK
jgi:hypothetical protein